MYKGIALSVLASVTFGVVMSEVGSEKLDSQEIFEEIVSLLHCYSMKLYSNRNRLQKIKEAIEDDETSGTPPA